MAAWTRLPRRVGRLLGVTATRPAPSSSWRALRAELGQQPQRYATVETEGWLRPCRSLTRNRYAKMSFARGLILTSNRSARM